MVRTLWNKRMLACALSAGLCAACGADAGRLTPVDSSLPLRVPKTAEVADETASDEHRAIEDNEDPYELPDTDTRFIAPYTVQFEPARAYLFATQKQPTPTSLTIRNRGTEPFTVLDSYIGGGTLEAADRFRVMDPARNITLQPGESTTIRIEYLGGTYETTSAAVVFATSIPHNGIKQVPVMGKIFR